MAKRRYKSALWIGLIGVTILILIAIIIQNAKVLGIGGVGILVLFILMKIIGDMVNRQVDHKIKLEKRAIRGAKAEEKIGDLLPKLSADYYVLNDINSPYGNIDHIVIGKNTGIFLIETKAHGGRVEIKGDSILINGKTPEKDFIAQALQNSYWLRDRIGDFAGSKPWITPILVFTNAFVPFGRPIKGVQIVNKKYLQNVLGRANNPNAVHAKIWDSRESIVRKIM